MGYPFAKIEKAVENLGKRFPDACSFWGPSIEAPAGKVCIVVSLMDSGASPNVANSTGPGALMHDIKVVVQDQINRVGEREFYTEFLEPIIEEMQKLGFKFKRSGYMVDDESNVPMNAISVDFTIVF